jgi:hypothetical protein
MKPCKADLVRIGLFLLFLLATVPAYCQRGTLDLNVGQVSDQFAAFTPATGAVLDINGQIAVIKASAKTGRPAIVGGGEVRTPFDTSHHAQELAVFGGVVFGAHNFSVEIDGEVRKIYTPPANSNGQIFNRSKMELFELPVTIKYKFGPAKRAFISVKGETEFTPRFKPSPLASVALPDPGFDHGYMLRGNVGYDFGKWWYIKGTYETRFLKFNPNDIGNPNNLYNWKSNLITGGVGLRF